MGAPLVTRADIDPEALQRLVRWARDRRVTARQMALTTALDGMRRDPAALAARRAGRRCGPGWPLLTPGKLPYTISRQHLWDCTSLRRPIS